MDAGSDCKECLQQRRERLCMCEHAPVSAHSAAPHLHTSTCTCMHVPALLSPCTSSVDTYTKRRTPPYARQASSSTWVPYLAGERVAGQE